MILLRHELGDVLREQRQDQGRTLRDVSSSAKVSLGYLSEIERGEKEASSEMLTAISSALGLELSATLDLVTRKVAHAEALDEPVRLPVASSSDSEVVPAA